MSDRRELRCPGCGAPLTAAAAKSVVVCGQCGTASEPAPKGPEKIVQTFVVERVVVRDRETNVVLCPRCNVGLFAVTSNEIFVHGCGVCGGIWLDNAGSLAITKHADPQLAVLAARADRNAVTHHGTSHQKLDCPACNRQMERVHTGLAELDICRTHGTWFDSGELRRVMMAYNSRNDDELAAIPGTRDLTEAKLAALAKATELPPDPWEFNGPTASRIVDGGVKILGALVLGALTPPPPRGS